MEQIYIAPSSRKKRKNEKNSEDIESDTMKFIKNGGKIQEIPNGVGKGQDIGKFTIRKDQDNL